MKPIVRYILLLIASVLFTAPPMLVLRRLAGRLPYWASMVLASGLIATLYQWPYGIVMLTAAVMIGVYVEIEQHNGSVFTAGFVGVLAAIGTAAFAVGLWVNRTSGHLVEQLREQIAPLAERTASINAGLGANELLVQLPSILTISCVISLAVALILEKPLMHLVAPAHGDTPTEFEAMEPTKQIKAAKATGAASKLSSFRVPDVFIWLTIASIFGAFYRHGNELAEVVSVNAMNVFVIMFFFQGLAVVAHAFRIYKVSPLWQLILYVLFVAQLFLLVTVLGFADFWMEFRTKLTAKPAENKRVL